MIFRYSNLNPMIDARPHVLDQWRDGIPAGGRCGPPEPIK
jgi:hypothetical protein